VDFLCFAGTRKAALGGAPVARRNRRGYSTEKRVFSRVLKKKRRLRGASFITWFLFLYGGNEWPRHYGKYLWRSVNRKDHAAYDIVIGDLANG
jgi:hypothetical protein